MKKLLKFFHSPVFYKNRGEGRGKGHSHKRFLKKLAFSLVELMISLIVISIVTAAFAPLITKKLKTSDQSIGTATPTSITSSTICNSVSKGCIECEDDKCLAASDGYFINASNKSQACNSVITGCAKCSDTLTCSQAEDGYYMNGSTPTTCPEGCAECSSASACSGCKSGYYLNGSNCSSCSSAMTGCAECNKGTACTKCNDDYSLISSKCVKCPNHCKACSTTKICSVCNSGFTLTDNNACYKYECGDNVCLLTTDTDSIISIYRYNLGDNGGLKLTSDMAINICYAGAACPHGFATPLCWRANEAMGIYTANYKSCGDTKYSKYSGCTRTVCNWQAANVAQQYYNDTGWRLANVSEVDYISHLLNAPNPPNIVDPFCGSAWGNLVLPDCLDAYNCKPNTYSYCAPRCYNMEGKNSSANRKFCLVGFATSSHWSTDYVGYSTMFVK